MTSACDGAGAAAAPSAAGASAGASSSMGWSGGWSLMGLVLELREQAVRSERGWQCLWTESAQR